MEKFFPPAVREEVEEAERQQGLEPRKGERGDPEEYSGPDFGFPPDDAAYAKYLEEVEADERRAIERLGKAPPHSWGDRLDEENYFCLPCWKRGLENGAHPYDQPPCDPIGKGDWG